MSRLISFALTEPQILNRSKTQTRRLGWAKTKPGERLIGCRKVQGRRRKDGTVEPLVRLAEIEVVSVRREPLDAITPEDVVAEGFPGWTPAEFVAFFCRSMKVEPDAWVTRIEFRYLDAPLGSVETAVPAQLADAVATAAAVRRLTPVECERLQGFPDNWTATSNGKAQADSPRYRELGNTVAVPVFEWVTERLVAVDAQLAHTPRSTESSEVAA